MKTQIMTLVKYFKVLSVIYRRFFGILINTLKLFIKQDEKLILFSCFGGKKYDDSPKAVYEKMIGDKRFDDYKIVWAFHNPENFKITRGEKIKTDNLKYFITALKARCWITNSAIERGIPFKGKNTFYLNTWHGTPIKRMGSDKYNIKKVSKSRVDIMNAQGEYEADIFSKVFRIPRDNFLMCGLPRNDLLANYTEKMKREIKQKLNIPLNKKIILYAPTFRDYERDSLKNCVLRPPIDLKKWQEQLGEKYCLLFRAHYEVAKSLDIVNNEFVMEMSSYPALDELMIIADILISDYSSIFFDFSVMDKVMLHFTYDYDLYQKERGMYFDIRQKLTGADNEDQLIEILKNCTDEEKEKTKAFRGQYVNYFGNATEKTLDCIYNNIKGS